MLTVALKNTYLLLLSGFIRSELSLFLASLDLVAHGIELVLFVIFVLQTWPRALTGRPMVI